MKKKIAIVLDVEEYDWNGGINYFNNLINLLDSNKFEINIIIGFKTIIKKNKFDKKFKFIKSKLCDPRSLSWFIRKIFFKVFKKDYFLIKFLEKNKFKFLTHSVSLGNQKKISVVNWIPDLQPFFLNKNFKKKEISKHYNQFLDFYKFSDTLIFSSNTEKKKFKKIFKIKDDNKIKVFNNIPSLINEKKIISKKKLFKKFNINKNFFFIPNQFWKHKNHILLFRSIKSLKLKNTQFIFSGQMDDYRDLNYIDILKTFIKENDLNNFIKILGNINYSEVVSLIIHSKALINPSNYEGWSTSVEEAKIYKKNLILSDIDTHLEQVKNREFFFKKNNEKSLSKKIKYFNNKILKKIDFKKIKQEHKIKINNLEYEIEKIYT